MSMFGCCSSGLSPMPSVGVVRLGAIGSAAKTMTATRKQTLLITKPKAVRHSTESTVGRNRSASATAPIIQAHKSSEPA